MRSATWVVGGAGRVGSRPWPVSRPGCMNCPEQLGGRWPARPTGAHHDGSAHRRRCPHRAHGLRGGMHRPDVLERVPTQSAVPMSARSTRSPPGAAEAAKIHHRSGLRMWGPTDPTAGDRQAACSSPAWKAGHRRPGHRRVRREQHDRTRRVVRVWAGTRGARPPAAPRARTQVVPQVPPVGDLHRAGRTVPGAGGVAAGPVPADHLHAGVGAEPAGTL